MNQLVKSLKMVYKIGMQATCSKIRRILRKPYCASWLCLKRRHQERHHCSWSFCHEEWAEFWDPNAILKFYF